MITRTIMHSRHSDLLCCRVYVAHEVGRCHANWSSGSVYDKWKKLHWTNEPKKMFSPRRLRYRSVFKTSRVAWIPAWWGCECLWRCCVHWSHTSTLTALSKAVVCWRSAAFESQGFVFYSLWLWIQLNVKHFNEKIIWNYWHFYLLTKWQIIKKDTFCLNTQPVCIPLPSVL